MEKVKFEDVWFYYDTNEAPAIRSINAVIPAGSLTLICGPSGSGKSTLLLELKKELTPVGRKKGRVLLDGKEIEELSREESAAKVGYVMQQPENQIVTDSVWHELAFGLENLGEKPAIMRRKVAETANFFGISNWFDKKVEELSGGQKQILNLAAVMVMQPEILVLDEPTAQLDPIAAKEFLQMLLRINQELGITVIICEHRLDEVLVSANQVLFLSQGTLQFAGNPQEFVSYAAGKQEELYEILPAPVKIALGCGAKPPFPLSIKEGREWAFQNMGHPAQYIKKTTGPISVRKDRKRAALTAKNIWFRYRPELPFVLRGCDIQINGDEIHALVGGNGSGKSTLLGILGGIYQSQRGKVKKNEGLKTVLLMQDPKSVFSQDSVLENLKQSRESMPEIDKLADTFGLKALYDHHPYDLSGGEMQMLAFAIALLQKPNILLLDEPTKGLDVYRKKQLGEHLKALRDQGKAIVLVTHDLEFVAEYADRCSMVFDGENTCTCGGKEFFSGNHFYTTSANRMTRGIAEELITVEDVITYAKGAKIL